MKQVIKQELTGRFVIIKVFPFIHALKVEVCETFINESKENSKECRWRLASDKDILDLRIQTTGESQVF